LKDGSTLIRVPLADIRWIDVVGDYAVDLQGDQELKLSRGDRDQLGKSGSEPRIAACRAPD
jgi:hypothetical protein